MTALALSDCIRSTPSRTIGALLLAVLSRAEEALGLRRDDATRGPIEGEVTAGHDAPRGGSVEQAIAGTNRLPA